MSDAKPPPVDQALVALFDQQALIRVEGRGNFKMSTSLKQFGETVADRKLPLILLDMTHCIGMDSTFMGVLAGMASRIKTYGGAITLVHCSPRIRGLLATLGLDQIVDAYEAGKTPAAYHAVLTGQIPREKLAPSCCQDVETVKTMLDAHQNLVDLAPENLPQFKDVLVFLREEVARKTGDRQEAG